MGVATVVTRYLANRGIASDIVLNPHTERASASAEASHVPANRVAKPSRAMTYPRRGAARYPSLSAATHPSIRRRGCSTRKPSALHEGCDIEALLNGLEELVQRKPRQSNRRRCCAPEV
jgi:hypothetical protein